MFFNVSSCSAISASISSPISLYRRISRIAVAWRSEKWSMEAVFSESLDLNLIPSVSPVIRHFFACLIFLLPRRISMIKSMTSQALIRPSWISHLSCSFFSRVVYLRVASSYWNCTLWRITDTSPIVSGFPLATASIFTPKVSSSRVFLYKRLHRFCASAPFFSSMTIRMPALEDWLEISTISDVFFVSTRLYTSFRNLPIFAPIMVYGISVITIRSFPPFIGSISTFPRSLIFPFPDS